MHDTAPASPAAGLSKQRVLKRGATMKGELQAPSVLSRTLGTEPWAKTLYRVPEAHFPITSRRPTYFIRSPLLA
jgi:hypothetical protein